MDERVLLVEDDPSIREVAGLGLSQAGFRVTTSGDGRDGLIQFRNQRFDLVVLDIMLPELDGYEVCRQIRAESRVPIIMLSARSDTVDVVVGLELGADDYVTKPFELPELVARSRAALRRASAVPEDPVLTRGDLEIDPAAFVARKNGEEVNLTVTEFSSCSRSRGGPGRSSRASFSSNGSGTTSTSATRDSWTWPSSASAPRSRTIRRSRST
jgi:two-component system response regulator MtrA